MNKTNLLVFHGSPGRMQDFSFLKQLIAKERLTIINRYFGKKFTPKDINTEYSIVAYSWGCYEFFKFITENPQLNIKRVLFISPYIFVSKPPSQLLKLLFNIPYLGEVIIQRIGFKAIDKMLIDASHPREVPESFADDAKHYKSVPLLKKAALEKHFSQIVFDTAVDHLKELHLSIIWGKDDLTSTREMQITPLIKALPTIELTELENAGHGLPWTHREELIKQIKMFLA